MDNLQRIFGQPTGYDEENKPDPKKELREKVTLELGSVIYSDDQRERKQGSHREVHKESGKREGYRAATVI